MSIYYGVYCMVLGGRTREALSSSALLWPMETLLFPWRDKRTANPLLSRETSYQSNLLLRIHSGTTDLSSFIIIVDLHSLRSHSNNCVSVDPTHHPPEYITIAQHAFDPPYKSTCCTHCHFCPFDSLYYSMITLNHPAPSLRRFRTELYQCWYRSPCPP